MSEPIEQGEDVQEDLDQAAHQHDSEASGMMDSSLFSRPFHWPPITPRAEFEAEMAQLHALEWMIRSL